MHLNVVLSPWFSNGLLLLRYTLKAKRGTAALISPAHVLDPDASLGIKKKSENKEDCILVFPAAAQLKIFHDL